VLKNINNAAQATGQQLAEARKRKGLSQRDLAARVGIQQAHLSKIELGKVDTRLSSLVEIARALDLDVQLVPRQAIAAVQGAVRAAQSEAVDTTESRALATLARYAADYTQDVAGFGEAHPDREAAWRLNNTIADIRSRPLTPETMKALQPAIPLLEELSSSFKDDIPPSRFASLIRLAERSLRRARHLQLGAARAAPATPAPQPAYRLDDEDEDD